jgi:hypothetical protein
VAQPRAADDFETIRARMKELRRVRDAAERDLRSVQPTRHNSNPVLIFLRRLKNRPRSRTR